MGDLPEVIIGMRLYEFFRSKGYKPIPVHEEEEFGIVVLEPPTATQRGYIPVPIYYSHPYTLAVLESRLNREGYSLNDFEDWFNKRG
jgi:hypothetical protein